MGRVADVIAIESDGNVKVDPGGGDTAIADHFADSGDDSPPLPGDKVALVDGPESGTQQVTGYADETEKVAAKGEKRIYGRDPDGNVVAEVHLKGDGTIVIKNLAASPLGVVTVGADGSVTVQGDITSEPAGPGTDVTLATHLTPSPLGPLGPPIPGT